LTHQQNMIEVSGTKVNLRRCGSGKPLLFLHGASGVMTWMPFFDALGEHREVLVPDHPGFGLSDEGRWLGSMGDLAMFYLDLIEQLDLRDIDLVGNSLGGWLAAEIAVRNLSRIRSVSLIAPAGIRVRGMPCGDNFIWGPEEQVRNLFHDQSFADRLLGQTLDEAQVNISLRNRFAATRFGWQPRWFNPDLEKWLHRIKVPAHVIWGDDDKLLPSGWAPHWKACLPDAKLTMISGCGHLPHVEHADKTARALVDFLKGVAA
jgi:pimeloyl-ACP methyl ester carboxylesterase